MVNREALVGAASRAGLVLAALVLLDRLTVGFLVLDDTQLATALGCPLLVELPVTALALLAPRRERPVARRLARRTVLGTVLRVGRPSPVRVRSAAPVWRAARPAVLTQQPVVGIRRGRATARGGNNREGEADGGGVASRPSKRAAPRRLPRLPLMALSRASAAP